MDHLDKSQNQHIRLLSFKIGSLDLSRVGLTKAAELKFNLSKQIDTSVA